MLSLRSSIYSWKYKLCVEYVKGNQYSYLLILVCKMAKLRAT